MRTLLNDFWFIFRNNIRDYGMYIALAGIFIFFTLMTGGLFVSSRNIFNLIQQTGFIAVGSVGMTLIIVIRHIDLSVGSIAGVVGAMAAVLIVSYGVPAAVALPSVLIFGALAGLLTGYLVAKVGIPAFVASLGGMFVYRGLIFNFLQSTGTLGINDPIIEAIGRGTIPSIATVFGMQLSSLIVGILAIAWLIYAELGNRKKKIDYNFEVLPKNLMIIKLVFMSLIIAVITYVLGSYRGISWVLVIVGLVLFAYHFMTTKTILGRHIFAVGGNPEASELSGISVEKITYFVFSSMGFLSALSGIMYLARLQSATFTAGEGLELQVIAGAFVGGTSAAGGIGKVTGSVIGALVMASLINGMQMLSLGSNVQNIISGVVLVLAVIFDVKTRTMKKTEKKS